MLHLAEDHHRPTLRLGAILAGGQSRRFGSTKQLATLDGAGLVERSAATVRSAGARAVAIIAPGSPDLRHILPCREDARPGNGPLGGLHTALAWARELGLAGTLCIACDTPFLPAALLRQIAVIGESSAEWAVAPESKRGGEIEPLCAWYPVTAVSEIESRLEQGRLSLTELIAALPLRRIPLEEVESFGTPDSLFLNINTPDDHVRAEAMQIPGGGVNGAR